MVIVVVVEEHGNLAHFLDDYSGRLGHPRYGHDSHHDHLALGYLDRCMEDERDVDRTYLDSSPINSEEEHGIGEPLYFHDKSLRNIVNSGRCLWEGKIVQTKSLRHPLPPDRRRLLLPAVKGQDDQYDLVIVGVIHMNNSGLDDDSLNFDKLMREAHMVRMMVGDDFDHLHLDHRSMADLLWWRMKSRVGEVQ